MRKTTVFCLLLPIMFTGCISRQAFYVSPFNAHEPSYHTIPLKADSIRAAYYAGAVISVGAANRGGRDDVFSFQSNLGGSHNFGSFQAFYSGNVAAGNYEVSKYDSGNNSYSVNYRAINKNAGNKFFYGAGLDGGINIVVPFRGGEWRIIGIQTSLQKEYGKYLSYRNQLPDSAATLIIRNGIFTTLGGYTEIMCSIGNESSIGFKLAAGKILGNSYLNSNVYDNVTGDKLAYGYINLTLNYSNRKWTGFFQVNSATKAYAAMFGVNYRIAKSRR